MKSVFEEIVDAHVVCPAESPEISKLRAELSRACARRIRSGCSGWSTA